MDKNIFATPVFANKTIEWIVNELLRKEWFDNGSQFCGNALLFFKIRVEEYTAIIKDEFIEEVYDKAKEYVKEILSKSVWQCRVNCRNWKSDIEVTRRIMTKNPEWKLFDFDWDELESDWKIKLKRKEMEWYFRFWSYDKDDLPWIAKKNTKEYLDKKKYKKVISKARKKVTEEDLKKLWYL